MPKVQNISSDLDELALNPKATGLFWALFYVRVLLFFAILPIIFTCILELTLPGVAPGLPLAGTIIGYALLFAFYLVVVLVVLAFFMGYFEDGLIEQIGQFILDVIVLPPIGFIYDFLFQTPRMFVARLIESTLRFTGRPHDCMHPVTIFVVLGLIVVVSWLSFLYWLPLYETVREESALG